MKSLMKFAFVGLVLLSTAAYANNKHKKSSKKHQVTHTCPASCPKKGC